MNKTAVALTVAGLAATLVAFTLVNMAMGTFRPDYADLAPNPNAVKVRAGDELAVWLSTSAEAVDLRVDSRDVGIQEYIQRNPENGAAVVLGEGFGCLDAVVSGLEVASVTDTDATVTLTLDKELGTNTTVYHRHYAAADSPPATTSTVVAGDSGDITLTGLTDQTSYRFEASTDEHMPAAITRSTTWTAGVADSGTSDQDNQEVKVVSATGVILKACRESEDVAITLHGNGGQELNNFLVDVLPAKTVNSPPVFDDGLYVSRQVCVRATGRPTTTTTTSAVQPTPAPTTSRTTTNIPDYLTGGESVGPAVVATDSDSSTVIYALGVGDPNDYYLFFDVDSSGQLTVNDAGALDYAGLAYDQVYPIVLTAEDGAGGSGSILVAVSIDVATLC